MKWMNKDGNGWKWMKVYFLKVCLAKINFPKVYFPKEYFLKVHFPKVFFSKAIFLKIVLIFSIFQCKFFTSCKMHFSDIVSCISLISGPKFWLGRGYFGPQFIVREANPAPHLLIFCKLVFLKGKDIWVGGPWSFENNLSSTFVSKIIYYFQQCCSELWAFEKGNSNWFDISFKGVAYVSFIFLPTTNGWFHQDMKILN